MLSVTKVARVTELYTHTYTALHRGAIHLGHTFHSHGGTGSSSQNHRPVAFAPVSAEADGGGGGGRLASRLAAPRAGADLEGRRLRVDAAFRAGLGAGGAGPGSGAPPGGVGAAVRAGGAARALAPAAPAAADGWTDPPWLVHGRPPPGWLDAAWAGSAARGAPR